MNPEQFLDHFDRISDAPDAIPRLRRFILDLAVRGKLVEQDPRDEPAHRLLETIKKQKIQMLLDKGIRGEQEVERSIPINAPEIPTSWAWAYVDDVAIVQGGKRLPKGAKLSEEPTGHIYIRVTDMKNGTISPDHLQYVSREVQLAIARYTINKEDLYITIAGTIGQVGRVPEFYDGHNLTENAAKIVFRGLNGDFLCLVLSSQVVQQQFKEKTKQMAQPKLALKRILGAKFPLPPLAEQHRIVATVDELMALCDRLEKSQAECESRRDRLVASSLNRLNNGAEPDAFRDHARFYFNHLPRLTTKPEHIQQLRQTILNLAVRGKLVPQDPNDEPVSMLLENLRAEQEELIKTRVLKLKKEEAQLLEDELPLEVPPTWQWVPLSRVIVFGPQNGISPKPSSQPDALKAITLTATTSGQFDPQHFKRVEANIPPNSEFWLRSGDLLFQRGNTREYVGIAAYYMGEPRQFLYPDLMMKVRLSQTVSLRYVHLWSLSPPARGYFSARATGAQATMPKINQGILLQLPIPLPPLAEQHRIVAKVDELMALLDKLEAQIATTHADSRRFLEAVLHGALAGPSEFEQGVLQ
ncbi:MAG: restriction endonuclease subunit S [Nitrospira sp.]|nr:restriction endonuclease subunit S [Nitrospira sp.]